MVINIFLCIETSAFALFSKKIFETQGSTLTGLQIFASVELSLFKVIVIPTSINSLGKFFCMITWSFHIFVRYSQLISGGCFNALGWNVFV